MEKGKGEGIILIANRVQRIDDSGTRYGVRGVRCGVCEPCLIQVDCPQQINTLTNQHIKILTRVQDTRWCNADSGEALVSRCGVWGTDFSGLLLIAPY